jgi:hypothetical protein
LKDLFDLSGIEKNDLRLHFVRASFPDKRRANEKRGDPFDKNATRCGTALNG